MPVAVAAAVATHVATPVATLVPAPPPVAVWEAVGMEIRPGEAVDSEAAAGPDVIG